MLADNLYEFATLVDEGSVTAAAAKLGLSRSALTGHIHDMERQLGVALVEREHAGAAVRLSDAGRFAYRAAREMIDLAAPVADGGALPGTPSGARMVRIGGLTSANNIVNAFHEATGTLQLSGLPLEARFLLAETPAGGADALHDAMDVLVTYRSHAAALADDPALRVVDCAEIPGLLALHPDHPLASRPYLDLWELNGLTLGRIAGRGDNLSAMWDEFVAVCERSGFTPRGRTSGVEYVNADDDPALPLVFSADNALVGQRRSIGRVLVPVRGLLFSVVSVCRADDHEACRLADEVHRILNRS